MLTPIYELKHNYINVNGFYGGSQNFFKDDKGLFNQNRARSGCGLVAITDTVCYLRGLHNITSLDKYKRLFKASSRRSLWIPMRSGITFIQETIGLKASLTANRLPYKCHWCFRHRYVLDRISYMLQNDTPVILCIPRTFGLKTHKAILNLYNDSLSLSSATSGHFVTVTGLMKDSQTGRLYYRISSWGKIYYISHDEYIDFLRRHPMGLLGNIMLIERV